MEENAKIKDLGGAREVEFLIREGSIFMWDRSVSYEFDLGIFSHQMKRLLATGSAERTPFP